MKLIDLSCSKCGAALKVNSELTKCMCQYCGNEMLVDDEAQKIEISNGTQFGYETEKGKVQFQENERKHYTLLFAKIKETQDEINRVNIELNDVREKIKKIIFLDKNYKSDIIMPFAVWIFPILGIAINSDVPNRLLAIILWSLISLTFLLRYVPNHTKKRNNLLLEKQNILEPRLHDLTNRSTTLNQHLNSLCEDIPVKYRNPDIVPIILEYFVNHRVDTFKEAVNLYEATHHYG